VRNQSIFLSASLLSALLSLPTLHAQAPVPDSPAIEQQVDAMLAKLTLQQKLELIGGEENMYIRA
jgi:beta-glucosidase